MPFTADRLTGFTESVIREMTRVAHQYDAINLSQGFPDADPPAEVLAAGSRAMAEGPHQYAITWGMLSVPKRSSTVFAKFTIFSLWEPPHPCKKRPSRPLNCP